ncbi:hypothetical protein ZHAS_00001680 [Anopheles sinensis]|nr:hypothetical protein ZHAS_00001680 [Anopheles sinensis]
MQPSRQIQSVSLGKRVNKLEHDTTSVQFDKGIGRREITFTLPDRSKGRKTDQEQNRSRQQMLKKHKEERRQVIRSAKGVIKKMVMKKPYGQ